MNLYFHGGAGEVTGANYLLETAGAKILIDCGLVQGATHGEDKNFAVFPYDLASIDALFITHAHIDHIGRIPRLVAQGFRGPIYSTAPTRDLAELSLEDSAGILAREAAGHGHAPLYTPADIEQVMKQWQTLEYHAPLTVKDVKIILYDSGHILGASEIVIEAEGKRIVFTGDLGNAPMPILRSMEYLDRADYVVIESCYGDRVHESKPERQVMLERAIEDVVRSGGVLLMPIFAVERTQEILYEINNLIEHGRVPRLPVFIDSPFAIRATAIYQKYDRFFNHDAMAQIKSGDDLFNFPGLRLTLTKEQSKEINAVPAPKLIMAGSGMSTGGRILHHERRYLSDPKSMILFIGYQAYGTLGRRIFDGAETVEIFGERVPVRCQVRAIGGYSAHADQNGLREFIDRIERPVKQVFVVQGELPAAEALAQVIKDQLGIMATVPKAGEVVTL